MAMGEIRPMLEKMTSKMEDMHAKAIEEKKKKCAEDEKMKWDEKTKTCVPK